MRGANKNGKLIMETLAVICITAVGYLYCQRVMESYYNFEEVNPMLPLFISPLVFFLPAYMAGRWIFHYVVCSVHTKALHVLFIIQVIILGIYLAAGIFWMIMSVTGLGMANRFFSKGYAYFFMFSGSNISSAIFAALGILFAFSIGSAREK